MNKVTQSIFKKENKGKKNDLCIFFFKNRIIFMINPFRERTERGFVFIYLINVQNSDDRRPAASGIILADLRSFSIAYFLRQRFSFETRLKIARFDKDCVETLSFGRSLRLRPDDSSGSTYEYDKNSNLTKHITPSGNDIDYTYDALNRRLTKEFESDSDLDITYGYDVGSRMTSADTTASQIDYTYDALNRVVSTTQTVNSNAYTLDFEYDDVGNRTEVAYPGGKVVNYVYDDINRMTDINVNSSGLVDYVYDTLDRRTEKSFISTNLPKAAYTYDIANQLTSLDNDVLPSTSKSQFDYTYDNVGNRDEMVVTGTLVTTGTFTYAYNDIYELTGVSGADSHSYAYDNVGNRTTVDSVNYTSNGLNQYTQVASTNFSYDGNDNLSDDGTNDYTYDESNRLLTFSDGTDSASYEYDAFNRRISKTVNSVTTYFVYDGNEVVEEYNSSDVLQADYVMGDDLDEPLTMTRSSTTYYYHLDGLGSIKQITNGSGVIQESYDYDPYGNTTIYNSSGTPVSASVIGNRFMFTGREYDEESGIYHYRARQYAPSIGRFLQRDPLEYLGGINLFEYVRGNPVKYVDPMGLLPTPLPKPGSGVPLPGIPPLPTLPGGLPTGPGLPNPEQPIQCEGTVPLPMYPPKLDMPTPSPFRPDISACWEDPTLSQCQCENGWLFDCEEPPELPEVPEQEDQQNFPMNIYQNPVGPLLTPTLNPGYLYLKKRGEPWYSG